MKRDTSQIIQRLGITEYFIEKRLSQVLDLAGKKGIDLSWPVLIGYDVQGPQVRLIDANFTPLIHLHEAMMFIYPSPKSCKALISGWDLETLRSFRQRRLGMSEHQLMLIGENGAVFEKGGIIHPINSISENIHFTLKQQIFIEAAKLGLKIAIQGNVSNRAVCVYFEGDEPSRGDTRNHFLVKDTDLQTQDLYELIREKLNFSFDGKKIKFEPSLKNIKEIDFVLGRVRPLNSVRLSWEDLRICLRRDNADNHNFTLEDMKSFSQRVAPEDWEVDPNPDFCVDFRYKGDLFSPSKESTANLLAQNTFGVNKYVLTNIGDKKGDVFIGENAIFFAMDGSPAEEYCRKQGIDCVVVQSGIDYSVIMGEMLNQETAPLLDLNIEDVFLSAEAILGKKEE